MKYLKYFIITFFFLNLNLSNADEINLHTKITKNLRCLICQGQSVYDSDSEFANSLKILVKKKIDNGATEKQIYKFLKDKYGEWIIFEPKFNKNTFLLWVLPILLFLVGGFLILRNFKVAK